MAECSHFLHGYNMLDMTKNLQIFSVWYYNIAEYEINLDVKESKR